MNDEVRIKLKELVATYGTELRTDIRKTEGLLRDHCGEHKREITVLIRSMEQRIPEEINAKDDTVDQLQFSRLVKKLHDNEGIVEEYAKWAVESWAAALGIEIETKNTVSSTDKESERMQRETKKSDSTKQSSFKTTKSEAELNTVDMPAPFDKWTINGDGTATDARNKLMWIRAPWGMEWNGNSFSGDPVKLSWFDATRLHGQSKYVESTNMEWAHPSEEDIKASRIENGYTWGTSIISFAGYADWRLPTIYEWRTIQFSFYTKKLSNREDRSQIYETMRTGFMKIFPAMFRIGHNYWPATCRSMYTLSGVSKWLDDVLCKVAGHDSSGSSAWYATFDGFIDDDAKWEKHILLVRNI